jgi:hypothetical protein
MINLMVRLSCNRSRMFKVMIMMMIWTRYVKNGFNKAELRFFPSSIEGEYNKNSVGGNWSEEVLQIFMRLLNCAKYPCLNNTTTAQNNGCIVASVLVHTQFNECKPQVVASPGGFYCSLRRTTLFSAMLSCDIERDQPRLQVCYIKLGTVKLCIVKCTHCMVLSHDIDAGYTFAMPKMCHDRHTLWTSVTSLQHRRRRRQIIMIFNFCTFNLALYLNHAQFPFSAM